MNEQLLLITGAERFMAWALLFMMAYLTYRMSQRVPDHEVFIPIRGMAVESFSWAVHQFNWWIHHVVHKMAGIETSYGMHLWVAGFAYVGAAIGAVMVMYALLHARFGGGWWVYAGGFVLMIWTVGYVIGLMWIKQA